jgi:hypothetical protein
VGRDSYRCSSYPVPNPIQSPIDLKVSTQVNRPGIRGRSPDHGGDSTTASRSIEELNEARRILTAGLS